MSLPHEHLLPCATSLLNALSKTAKILVPKWARSLLPSIGDLFPKEKKKEKKEKATPKSVRKFVPLQHLCFPTQCKTAELVLWFANGCWQLLVLTMGSDIPQESRLFMVPKSLQYAETGSGQEEAVLVRVAACMLFLPLHGLVARGQLAEHISVLQHFAFCKRTDEWFISPQQQHVLPLIPFRKRGISAGFVNKTRVLPEAGASQAGSAAATKAALLKASGCCQAAALRCFVVFETQGCLCSTVSMLCCCSSVLTNKWLCRLGAATVGGCCVI